jgi:hypothetical protein
MSEIKVNSIKGVGASAAAITVNNSDGTCTANITNNLSNRNLIINGAMQVAQRGTSTTSSGYNTVDRFKYTSGNTGNTVTQAQVDVASGTTPYTLGFRKALKISMSGAGTVNNNSYIDSFQKIEAQNVANSGWNYLSSSSNITVSFWVKVSTNQTFYVRLYADDTGSKTYCFSYTASGNNTWTKITKTIPGNANLLFNTDNGEGLRVQFYMFYGTDYTGSRNLDVWETAGSSHTPDQATTWYTAGASTWEMTGLQVEVSDHATSFEHRSFAQELALCQRYYQKFVDAVTGANKVAIGCQYTSSQLYGFIRFFCEMRAAPTIDQGSASGNNYAAFSAAYPNGVDFNSFNGFTGENTRGTGIYVNSVSGTAGQSVIIDVKNSTGGYIAASSEL